MPSSATSTLLLASDFCRFASRGSEQNNSSNNNSSDNKIPVRVTLLTKKTIVTIRRSRNAHEAQDDPWSTVVVSPKVSKAVSLTTGGLAILGWKNRRHIVRVVALQDLPAPIVLKPISNNENLYHNQNDVLNNDNNNNHRYNKDNAKNIENKQIKAQQQKQQRFVVQVPPTVAASLGFAWILSSSLSLTNSTKRRSVGSCYCFGDDTWMEPYNYYHLDGIIMACDSSNKNSKNNNNIQNRIINANSLGKFFHQPIPATNVTLKRVGGPISIQEYYQKWNNPSCTTTKITTATAATYTTLLRFSHKNLDHRLIQKYTLLSTHDEQKDTICVYEIVDILPRIITTTTKTMNQKPQPVLAYRTTSTTKYRVVSAAEGTTTTAIPSETTNEGITPMFCHRLPPIHNLVTFHCHYYDYYIKQSDNSKNNISKTTDTFLTLPPHPDSNQIMQSLWSVSSSNSSLLSPSERILHVVGTNHDHNVGLAIQVAADSLGMNYFSLSGLASFAHRSGKTVSSGSFLDKLTGLQKALQLATTKLQHPCVLHICDLDLEFVHTTGNNNSNENQQEQRHDEEEQFWSTIVNFLMATTVSILPKKSLKTKTRIPSSSSFMVNNNKYNDDGHGGGSCFPCSSSIIISSGNVYRYTPSLLVIVSTTKPFLRGPFMKNLLYPPILCSRPDPEYAKYLWNHTRNHFKKNYGFIHNSSSSTSSSSSSPSPSPSLVDDSIIHDLIIGRSARDILILKEQFRQRYYDSAILYHHNATNNATEVNTTTTKFRSCLEQLCKELDEKRRKQSSSLGRISNVQWDDVGGLANVRKEIMDTIEIPLKYPRYFLNATGGGCGSGRSGILLYGPPGTGKTMVAKAVATECNLPFISIKGPELLGSYVGESESNIRDVFSNARKAAISHSNTNTNTNNNTQTSVSACILFFDELDSLAPRRHDSSSGSSGVMDRVVATLASELDYNSSFSSSLSSNNNDKFTNKRQVIIFCMGATNRPDLLDPSLLRPGRLDRLVYLGIPQTSSDRAKILAAQLRKLRLEDINGDNKNKYNNTSNNENIGNNNEVSKQVSTNITKTTITTNNTICSSGTGSDYSDSDSNINKCMNIAKCVMDYLPANLTGADMSSIVNGALARAIQRVCDTAEKELQNINMYIANGDNKNTAVARALDDMLSNWEEDQLEPIITINDLLEASKEITPSVTLEELKKYDRLQDMFTS